MNTRAKTTRRAKDAASSFMKKVVSGRNVHSPTPEKDLPDTKTARQKQAKTIKKGPVTASSVKSSGREYREADNVGKSDITSRKRDDEGRSANTRDKNKIPTMTRTDPPNVNTRGKLKDRASGNKTERLVDRTEEPDKLNKETEQSQCDSPDDEPDKLNKETEQSQCDSPDDDEESTSTVTIIPRFGPASKETVKDSAEKHSAMEPDEESLEKDSSPQVVLSPTSKYITGKSGDKSQVYKLSLAPGSEGQLLQAGDTVKLGNTLLKITPKADSRSGTDKKGEKSPKPADKKTEDTDQIEYVSSLDTSIDEFEILDESMEDEEDEDVSYPSGQQDAFFSAFGLVKKTELPKDGKVNKLHRLAGGKLRRVLKPNFAPGMVYKDGKIVVEDTAEGSPKSKPKLPTKSQFAQKLDFSDVVDMSPSNSPKPKKREWLKPPPRRSKSPAKDDSDIPQPTQTKSGRNTSKVKSIKQPSEKKLKKHSSFPGETGSKKPSSMTKAKSNDDIDLNMLPFRRSSRQRDTKRKEWKHLLRACPDEFEEDPQWEEEIDQRRHRSQARLAKRLERERKTETQEKEQSRSDTSDEESSEKKKKEKSSKGAPTAKPKKSQRKEVEKQIKEADSSKKYADMYDEIILKRGSFNKIRKQADWGLAKKMLDEEQKKAKQRRLAAVKLMDSVDKGKSRVVTKGMGVYEGVSWEMSHIEQSDSLVKSQPTVETVTEEIIAPDGQVIKVKVEKDADDHQGDKPKKKKKKKVKDKEESLREKSDREEKKIMLSPKFVKMPTPVAHSKRDETPVSTTAANLPSRTTPMIVILGPDGKPLPPARSSYLCEKIRSTLEEVVQKPEMLRKGRVLELKEPKHKKLPSVYRQSRDGSEIEKEETSPAHQSFLPIVSVKTDFQRELECQVPHMCNICWVNDHMYCKNMKRLERDLPYTGGCMHYVPCRHYMHLDEHTMVNKARFLSVRKWQAMLAKKYFDNDHLDMQEEKFEDFGEYDEREDLAFIEDEDGNFIAVNAEGVRLSDEGQVHFENAAKTMEFQPKDQPVPVPATEEGGASPLPSISCSQDSGYHSELPDSQTNVADTSMESIETDGTTGTNAEEDLSNKTDSQIKNVDTSSSEVAMSTAPAITVTSPKKPTTSVEMDHEMSSEWKEELEESKLMCDETFRDSDAESDFDLTPPSGTEILNIQIRARAAQISRSLVFDEVTIDNAKSLCSTEEFEEESNPEPTEVEGYGAEVTVGDLHGEVSEDEKLMTALLYPEKCPTHYEFVQEDNASHNDIEETSEFIDIRGRKHRVIKVHIAKLDEETRGELMKSLSNNGGKKGPLVNHPSQTPDFNTGRKRKRTNSTDSNESEESDNKKKLSPTGSKKGLMQKTDVHQFSMKTQKAMRGPLTASSSIPPKPFVKTSPKEAEEQNKRPLSMQPIKINSTEAELPQELQDQSTSGEDGSQVLTFTTKEIREKKPELLSYIKRAGLAPVIAEKLKAEKASIERMVKDAEAQLAKLQDQVGEQKLLHKALFGEMKTVKEELQELQLMVVEDEAQAAKYRIKKSYLENRRRFLERRRDNCGQSVKYLIKFNEDGTLSEEDDDAELESVDKHVSEQQMELSSVEENERTDGNSDPKEQTPPPYIPKPVLQSVNTQAVADRSKDSRSKSIHLPSPPKVQRLIKPESQASPLRNNQPVVSQSVVPLEQTVEGSVHGQQQYLQIVGSDGKTQLLQIVGNSTNQQVFELVTTLGQQPVLRPVSVQKQQESEAMQTSDYPQEEQVQYISESPDGQVVISQTEAQEQIIITDASDEQVVQEHVVATEGSQEHVVYSDVPRSQLIVSDPQTEHIIVSEGTQEQVVVTGYPQEQVVEEVVMEETASNVAHKEVVISSNPQRISRPALQSLLRKLPDFRAKPGVSVLKPQIQQQIASGVPVMIVTQGSASTIASQQQTIYSVPSSSQTAVVTASQQAPSTSVVITSVPEVLQTDNIIETAFVTATQGENESEAVDNNGNSRVSVPVARQPQVIVQQQPQQQQQVVTHGQSGEMMNIDDIEVQPLQASQEDIMRTMESIASELLGVSSIDLAP